MDEMDWKSALSSEVFRGYLAAELAKQKANVKTAEQIELENAAAINDFEEFQNKVNASSKLKETFKKLQYLFQTNEKYAATVNQSFVAGVLLLNID